MLGDYPTTISYNQLVKLEACSAGLAWFDNQISKGDHDKQCDLGDAFRVALEHGEHNWVEWLLIDTVFFREIATFNRGPLADKLRDIADRYEQNLFLAPDDFDALREIVERRYRSSVNPLSAMLEHFGIEYERSNYLELVNKMWPAKKEKPCKGIEIEPGVFSGCSGGTDCPTCEGK